MHRVWIPLALFVTVLGLAVGSTLRAGTEPPSPGPLALETPHCSGQWVGFEETFNGTDKESDLQRECAPSGFTRVGPADRFAECEQLDFACLCGTIDPAGSLICGTVCNADGTFSPALCKFPTGKEGKGDGHRVACCRTPPAEIEIPN
jgi:hypothetical protein